MEKHQFCHRLILDIASVIVVTDEAGQLDSQIGEAVAP